MIYVMTFPFFINIMLKRSSSWVIPLFFSWPNNIRLESHPLANTIFKNSINFPAKKGNTTILIYFDQRFYLVIVIKSIYIDYRSLKSLILLHRCLNIHEFIYLSLYDFSIDFFIIITFVIGLGINSFGSESLSY